MKAIVLVAVFIAGFSTVQGVAAPIDLSAQTCKQFQASSPDEIKIILACSTATIKTRKTRRSSTPTNSFPTPKLGEYCSAYSTIGLITATDKFGDGKNASAAAPQVGAMTSPEPRSRRQQPAG